MRTMVDIDTLSVNELIRLYPQSVETFNRFGIDACCGGAARVREAAERDGADVEQLMVELRRVIGVPS